MKPRIPNGGFFAAKYKDRDLKELESTLRARGADTLSQPGPGILFAAWREFPGQGVWSNGKDAVAYDLDLTNEATLLNDLQLDQGADLDPGELLWVLYRKYGLDFLDRLRGAFGFALWDDRQGELVVATDPFGIRPVVYSRMKNSFAAASRIRQLLIDSSIPRHIDPEAIYHYLFFHAVCSPVSIYRDVRKLEPGKGLRFKNGSLQSFIHYDIRYRPENLPESHWIQTIPQEIRKAVEVYVGLSPREKTGCFLSGGTDSSSIAGFYTEITGTPARTFSIGFNESGYNELDYAYIASRHFGTEQHEYSVTPDDVLRLLDALPEIYDEPFGNASVVPAYYCARMARDAECDVLLGGDGGDEIFGGNERYVTNLVFEKYSTIPKPIRHSILGPLLNSLPNIGILEKAKKYVKRANMPNPERFYSYNLLAETDPAMVFRPEYLAMIDPTCFTSLARRVYRNAEPAHDTNRLLYIDMKFTMTDNDLRKVTQMAESTGIRVRYPFLDRDLVNFTTKIPATLKVKWKKNRYIFKKAMEGFLPQKIIEKKKHGMGLPVAPWFRKDERLKEVLNDLLFAGTPQIAYYFRLSFLREMQSAFEKDETSYFGDNLWVFFVLESWLRQKASQGNS